MEMVNTVVSGAIDLGLGGMAIALYMKLSQLVTLMQQQLAAMEKTLAEHDSRLQQLEKRAEDDVWYT